jgi:hypothetical protein
MPLRVTVSTIAECLRTDCNILGDKIFEAEVIRVETEATSEVTFTPSICPVVESLKGLQSSLSKEQPEI